MMRISSLLYVSRSTLTDDDRDFEIDRLGQVSRARNAEAGVTGALLCSKGCFAQILEGAEADVDATMARIVLDPRHKDIRILVHQLVPARQFLGWDIGYQGLASYVDARLCKLVAAPGEADQGQLADLMNLLRGFGATAP